MNLKMDGLVGKGKTADVFDIGDDKVVKLFHVGYSEKSIETEYQNSKLLNQLDIPAPKSYEIVSYGGQGGIIYDKINGDSLLEVLLKTFDVEKCTRLLASVHQKILCNRLPSASNIKTILRTNIENAEELNPSCKSDLLERLRELPDGDGLCHGDFHFGNVIFNQQQCYMIDFMDICKGHKNFDIARTVYLTEMAPVPAEMPNIESILEIKKRAADIYLKEMGVSREELSAWLTVTAAARLSELSDDELCEKNAILQYLAKQKG